MHLGTIVCFLKKDTEITASDLALLMDQTTDLPALFKILTDTENPAAISEKNRGVRALSLATCVVMYTAFHRPEKLNEVIHNITSLDLLLKIYIDIYRAKDRIVGKKILDRLVDSVLNNFQLDKLNTIIIDSNLFPSISTAYTLPPPFQNLLRLKRGFRNSPIASLQTIGGTSFYLNEYIEEGIKNVSTDMLSKIDALVVPETSGVPAIEFPHVFIPCSNIKQYIHSKQQSVIERVSSIPVQLTLNIDPSGKLDYTTKFFPIHWKKRTLYRTKQTYSNTSDVGISITNATKYFLSLRMADLIGNQSIRIITVNKDNALTLLKEVASHA